MPVILGLLDNFALLTLMGLGFFFVESARERLGPTRTQVLHGLSFGVGAFLVTTTPVTLLDGATIDLRAGPVILAGALAGPIGGLLAACLGALARGLVGGGFAFAGMAAFFVYALIGGLAGRFWIINPGLVSKPLTILILMLASFFAAGAMFFLISPMEVAILWVREDLPFILIANALSVTYAAIVVGLAHYSVQRNAEVVELNETLNLAKRAGHFGIWDFDVRTGRLNWDRRSAELHAIDWDDFEGTYEEWSRNVHRDDIAAAEEIFSRSLATGQPFTAEYRVQLPEGGERAIRGDAIVLRDHAGRPTRVVGSNLDLTELRMAEARLVEARSIAMQAQKFDTIGQLTGGVAHDFNNLLAVIMGNQELLLEELQRDRKDVAEMRALVDASIEATRRGAELTQNMLAYARKARLKPELTDLNRVVRETEKWLRRTIQSSVDIETVLQAGIWQTFVDRVSVQSALINLLVNARDALEGKGKVTIETGNIRIDADHVSDRQEDVTPGRYVMLAVSDNGTGISTDAMERIFDPFFTTKPVGKGSGLGLSMVQGFVKQSGGTIRVHSELGLGTSFKIYFPAVEDVTCPGESDDRNELHDDVRSLDSKRLLVVEDQEEVLAVLEKTLRAAGYEVVTAESGDEAYRIFRDDPRFDLVVTDIVMPGELQGPALAKKIRSLRLDVLFVFLSGYASEAVVHGNGLRPEDTRLMKPVSRKDLLTAVEAALAAPDEETRQGSGRKGRP